jgi:hypothetical protein
MPGLTLSLDELIGADLAGELLREGMIIKLQLKNPQPALIPRNVLAGQLVDNIMKNLNPSVAAESLYLYKKPSGSAAWSDAERNALYNEVLSLSSLKGIQYFSSSRNKMWTFYETSMVIDGPESKNPLPDPSYSVPPREISLYARQKDVTFGDNIYQYTYYARQDSLVLTQQNLTNMRYKHITMVGKNKLSSLITAIDTESYLVIYAVSMAKVISLPLFNQRIGRAFSTRLEALLTWFSGRADLVFQGTVP